MAKILEVRDVENPVVRWWKSLGLLPSRKMNGLGYRSWPDRIFPIPGGRPFWIEFKKPGAEPTPLQENFHKLMREQGYDIEVHSDKKEAIAAIQKRLDAAGYRKPLKR